MVQYLLLNEREKKKTVIFVVNGRRARERGQLRIDTRRWRYYFDARTFRQNLPSSDPVIPTLLALSKRSCSGFFGSFFFFGFCSLKGVTRCQESVYKSTRFYWKNAKNRFLIRFLYSPGPSIEYHNSESCALCLSSVVFFF